MEIEQKTVSALGDVVESPSVPSWRCATAYPILAVGVALIIPAGFLVFQSLAGGEWRNVALRPGTYLYLWLSTAVLLTVLGHVLGVRTDTLHRISLTDPLTGLANRRYVQARVSEELARVARYQSPLSVLFLDVDNFKAINDTQGHDAGDAALRFIAETLRNSSRVTDFSGRWGGDEFIVVAASTSGNDALELAYRIRNRALSGGATAASKISVSIGIADATRLGDLDAASLYAAADAALYEAKAKSRDHVVLARGERRKTAAMPGFVAHPQRA